MSKRKKKPLLKIPKLSKQQKILIGVGAGVLVAVVAFGRKRISPALLEINWLNDPSIFTRGIKNNNPGNIILTNEAWEGKIPREQNTDGKFEQFKTYAYGVRAMIVLLKNYMKTISTIEQIIYRWNPGNPNYVQYVANRMGIAANTTLPKNKQTIKALVQAIADFENGIKSGGFPAVTDDMFEAAWSIV